MKGTRQKVKRKPKSKLKSSAKPKLGRVGKLAGSVKSAKSGSRTKAKPRKNSTKASVDQRVKGTPRSNQELSSNDRPPMGRRATDHFETTGNREIDEGLAKVLAAISKVQRPTRLPVISDIFRAAARLTMESTGTLNLKITATTLKELKFSFKMFYPHRFTPKITMFGSARVPPKTPLYDFAKNFAIDAVKRKYMIVTGGGPGIMAAGNEGAEQKGGFGLNIRLPVEQTPNPFIDQKAMLIHYKYFFTRKLFLVKEATAFAFFPGGFGTFDEAFEVLTLLQTGKTNLIPVVLLEPKGFGFWEPLQQFMKTTLAGKGFIGDSDKYLFASFNSSQEALDYIDHFYSTYHSMRFIKGRVIFRLKRTLSPEFVKELSREFSDLTHGVDMEMSGPLPEEYNEPELEGFPRLVLPFDRRDYGRLRYLIDVINDRAV